MEKGWIVCQQGCRGNSKKTLSQHSMHAILSPTALVLENPKERLCAMGPTLKAEKGAKNCLYDLYFTYLNHKISHKKNKATSPPQIKEPSTFSPKSRNRPPTWRKIREGLTLEE